MNRAPLSIIIPTLNSASTLPATVSRLIPAVQVGLIRELIVSDGGSKDQTMCIAKDIGAIIVEGKQGRGRQLRSGANVANGDWFLFLHADTCLDDSWLDVVNHHINLSQDAGYFRLKYKTTGFGAAWVAGWANCRSKWFDLPYGDQGLLVSKSLYSTIGGHEEISIMEDVSIAKQLKGRLHMLDCNAITDPSRYLREGWFVRGFRNLVLLAKYLTGTPPEMLARQYKHQRHVK